MTREAILEARKRGATQSEIAASFGVSLTTLRQKQKDLGVGPRESRTPPVTREALAPLWADPRESIRSIARKFVVTADTIKARAVEYGLGEKPDDAPPQFTREQLTELWPNHTATEIARMMNCSEKTVRRWARRWKLKTRPRYQDPTEEEIRERAAEIRRGWPEWRLASTS